MSLKNVRCTSFAVRFLENIWKAWKIWQLPGLFSKRKFQIKVTILLIMQLSGSESLWESWKKLLELHPLFTWITSSSCWNTTTGHGTIHSTFSEGLERLLISHFIWERNITFSKKIKDYFAEDNCDAFDDSIVNMIIPLASQYKWYKEKAWIGELGNTTVLLNLSWPHISSS